MPCLRRLRSSNAVLLGQLWPDLYRAQAETINCWSLNFTLPFKQSGFAAPVCRDWLTGLRLKVIY